MVKFPGAPGRNWGLAGAGWVLSARAGCSKAPGRDPPSKQQGPLQQAGAGYGGGATYGRMPVRIPANTSQTPLPPIMRHQSIIVTGLIPKNGDKGTTLFTFPNLINNGDVEPNMSPKSVLVLVQTSFCGEVGFGIWLTDHRQI